MEQRVSLVDCWCSSIAYLCHQEYYPLLHSAGIPFTVSQSTQRLRQAPAYAGCLLIRHSRHAQERDKLATYVRPVSHRPTWFRLSCSMEGWQLFTGCLIKINGRVARNCFLDGLRLRVWKCKGSCHYGKYKVKLRSSFCRTQTAIDALYVRSIKKLIEMLISLCNITLVASSVFRICYCIWKIRSYGICAREIVYEYFTESFGLAHTGRVNSVEPVKLRFKPQLLSALNMCHLL